MLLFVFSILVFLPSAVALLAIRSRGVEFDRVAATNAKAGAICWEFAILFGILRNLEN